MRKSRQSLALALVCVLIAITNGVSVTTANAADTKPFVSRYSTNANGAILSIGNSLLTCPSSFQCTQAQNGASVDNNSFVMVELDVDSDSSTFNSSSSDLNLPDGAQVLFAGLYWGARLAAGTSGNTMYSNPYQSNVINFKTPRATAYQVITGTELARNVSSYNAYESFADVTSLVQAAGNGTYWGANVQAGTGADRYAGWALTIAYTAPGYPLRNLTVFDGFNSVGSGAPQSVTVRGFQAPLAGTVDAQLSMVVYEGDRSQTGDYTRLNNTQLATALSPGSNFFDSANDLNGASVSTRNPAYVNMLGFDIKNLGASGVIPNAATSATFTFSSNGDVYYPGVLALAINLYAPDFASSTKTVVNLSGSDKANPGDILQYTLMYANTGQDPATHVVSHDLIPAGTAYVPGSLLLVSTPDPMVSTPQSVSDLGTSFGSYDGTSINMNLGRGAGVYNLPNTGGTISVGDVTIFQFQVRVLDSAGGTTIKNIANLDYVTGTTGVPGVFTTPPVNIDVGLKADVQIVKDMQPTPAISGQAGVTTLTITNNGPNPALGVVANDPLPDDYTATSVTWATIPAGASGSCPTPTGVAATVVCNLPDMPAGQRIVITIAGSTSSNSTATTLSNIASVSTTSFDPDLSNNVDTVSISMTRRADMSIVKSPPTATVTPGEEITWTLTAKNECSAVRPTNPSGCLSNAADVVIADTVPDTTKLILLSATGGTGAGGAQGDVAVTCPTTLSNFSSIQCSVNGGTLKPGQTATVTIKGYIPGNVTSGTINNNSSVSSTTFDPDQSNNLSTATVTAGQPLNDIQLIKTGPATAIAGDRASYSITVQNYGPSDATNVQVVDALSTYGFTVDSATTVISDRGTCAIASGAVTCDFSSLPGPNNPGGDGAKANILISGVLVPANASGTLTNHADVTCDGSTCNQPPGPDPNPDTPDVPTVVTARADVSVSKTSNTSAIPSIGDSVTYDITVTNNGPSIAKNVVLNDTLPTGLNALTITPLDVGTCVLATLSCDLGDFAVGSTARINVTGQVALGGLTSFTEVVQASSDTTDPVPGNNTATWTHSGSPQADLEITKTSLGIAAGENGTYTVRVKNNGPQGAVNTVFTDTLPVGLTADTSSPSFPSQCSAALNVVTCSSSGTLLATAEFSVLIPVLASADLDAGTTITNTATTSSDTDDPMLSNNTASVTDTVTAEADVSIDYGIGYDFNPDLSLVVLPPAGTYTGAGSLRYARIHIENHGTAVAKNVQILSNVATTVFPDKASLPSWCHAISQEVVCNLAEFTSSPVLLPGEDLTFLIPFTISTDTSPGSFPDCGRAATCPGVPGGWASITTSTPETDTSNNYDTAPLVINSPQTNLQIAKTAMWTIPNPNGDGHDSYIAGDKFGYEIDLWVPADWDAVNDVDTLYANAADVALLDNLPVGFTATQVNTSQGTCSIGVGATSISCSLDTILASTDHLRPQVVAVYVYGTIDPSSDDEISAAAGAVNEAEATSSIPDLAGNPTDVRALVENDVIQVGDLQVSKLADAPTAYAGGTLGYTINTINNGPSNADNTVITDTLPLGLTLNLAQSPDCVVDSLTASGQQVIKCTPIQSGQPIGTIAANSSVNTRIVANTDSRDLLPYWCPGQLGVEGVSCPEVLPPADLTTEFPRDINNSVHVTSDAVDSKLSNNTDSVTTQILALADIAVTASVSTDTPSAGTSLTYTLTAVNLGPSNLDNPVADSVFPPGFVISDVNVPSMDCSQSHTGTGLSAVYTLHCVGLKPTPFLDSLPPGITFPGTVTVQVPADTPAGPYTATANTYSRNNVRCPNAAAGTCETNYANNAAAVTVNVVQVANTNMVKTLVRPNPIQAGEDVVYVLSATNNGPSVASVVTISDTIPTGLAYVSGQLESGIACDTPEQIDEDIMAKCSAGSLNPGETKRAILTFSVPASYTGELCNTALVGSGALDPDATDNSGQYCGTVTLPPPPRTPPPSDPTETPTATPTSSPSVTQTPSPTHTPKPSPKPDPNLPITGADILHPSLLTLILLLVGIALVSTSRRTRRTL